MHIQGQSSIVFCMALSSAFSGAKASDFPSGVNLKTSGKANVHKPQPQHSELLTLGILPLLLIILTHLVFHDAAIN